MLRLGRILESQWFAYLGLYGFLIAYAIYMLFTYKADPRYSLNYERSPSFKRLIWLSSFEKSILFFLLAVFALIPQRELLVVFSFDPNITSTSLIFLGVLSGVLIFFGGMPVNFLISTVRRRISVSKTKREVELEQLLASSMSSSQSHLFFTVFIASVLAGVLEELIFRGYLLGHLLYLTLPVVAIVVQAVFAFVPQLYQGVYNALLSLYGGVFFGVVFFLSGSLLAVVIAHITHDVVGFVFTFSSLKKEK
ncbi:MAG: CPBP family glutamic-type intramembrane protease [Candidatus Bathyarchaeales archaeon]